MLAFSKAAYPCRWQVSPVREQNPLHVELGRRYYVHMKTRRKDEASPDLRDLLGPVNFIFNLFTHCGLQEQPEI
jgi:hypothetical protein